MSGFGGGIDFDNLVVGPLQAIFGEAVTYQPSAGQPFATTGVFDWYFAESDPLGEGGEYSQSRPVHVSVRQAVLGVQLSAFLIQPAQGDILVARAGRFYVKEVQPDGHGGAKLMLNTATAQR